MEAVEAVTQRCPSCLKVKDGYWLSDGTFVCPNCVHPAVLQRWENEWKPIEAKRLAQEARRLERLRKDLKQLRKKRDQSSVRNELRKVSRGLRENRSKSFLLHSVKRADKYLLLQSLRTQADILKFKQARTHSDAAGAKLLGLGVAMLGYAEDDPYAFSAGLAIHNQAEIDHVRKSFANALASKQVIPTNAQIVRLIVAQDKSRTVRKQAVLAKSSRKRFYADVFEAYEHEGRVFGRIQLRKVLDGDTLAFEYEVEFEDDSGFWIIKPFCMCCGKSLLKQAWTCGDCIRENSKQTEHAPLDDFEPIETSEELDCAIKNIEDEIAAISPKVKPEPRNLRMHKLAVPALAALLLATLLFILWPSSKKGSGQNLVSTKSSESSVKPIDSETAKRYVQEYEEKQRLEKLRMESVQKATAVAEQERLEEYRRDQEKRIAEATAGARERRARVEVTPQFESAKSEANPARDEFRRHTTEQLASLREAMTSNKRKIILETSQLEEAEAAATGLQSKLETAKRAYESAIKEREQFSKQQNPPAGRSGELYTKVTSLNLAAQKLQGELAVQKNAVTDIANSIVRNKQIESELRDELAVLIASDTSKFASDLFESLDRELKKLDSQLSARKPTLATAIERVEGKVTPIFVLKNGTRIRGLQVVDAGEIYAIKDESGSIQKVLKTDIVETIRNPEEE